MTNSNLSDLFKLAHAKVSEAKSNGAKKSYSELMSSALKQLHKAVKLAKEYILRKTFKTFYNALYVAYRFIYFVRKFQKETYFSYVKNDGTKRLARGTTKGVQQVVGLNISYFDLDKKQERKFNVLRFEGII